MSDNRCRIVFADFFLFLISQENTCAWVWKNHFLKNFSIVGTVITTNILKCANTNMISPFAFKALEITVAIFGYITCFQGNLQRLLGKMIHFRTSGFETILYWWDLWFFWLQNIHFLTHSFPMHPFSTSWKHQKTVRLSDVFRG